MSAQVFGINAGQFKPRNNFAARQSETGGWTATQSFTALRGAVDDAAIRNTFSAGARATDLDPSLDLYWARLRLRSVDVSDLQGGLIEISVSYAGFAGLEANEGEAQPIAPRYFLKGSLRERSIMEHPEVVALSDADRKWIQGILDGSFDWDFSAGKLVVVLPNEGWEEWAEATTQPTAGDATNFAKLVAKGWTTYLAPVYTWEKVWESEQGLSETTLNDLGKVSTPDGSPTEANGSRDWMLTDASQEQTGEVYRNRLEWMLSERGGWEAAVYDY